MGSLIRANDASRRPPPAGVPTVTVMQDRHWPGVLALYEQSFGAWSTERFAARRRWQCTDNPFAAQQPARTLVGLVDDTVVGTISTFPLAVRTPHGRKLAACSGDLAAVTEQPLLPLLLVQHVQDHVERFASGMSDAAAKLGRMVGDLLIPLSETTFCYPLRRDGRVRRALRRRLPRQLRWAVGRWAGRAVAAIAPLGGRPAPRPAPPAPSDDRLVRLDAFDDAYDRLWQAFASGFDYCVDRDSRYMRWRHLEGPAQTIEVWALRRDDRELDGIVVIGERARLDERSRPCGTAGEILDLILRDPADAGDVEVLLAFALHRLDGRGVDDVTATGLCTQYHAVMRRLGFTTEGGSPFRIAVHFDPALEPAAALQRDDAWYLSAADGDQLYTVLL